MPFETHIEEQNAPKYIQNNTNTNAADRPSGNNSYMQNSSQSSSSSSFFTRQTFTNIRSKAEGFLNQAATKNPNSSFSRQISRAITAGTIVSDSVFSPSQTFGLGAASGPSPRDIEPSEEEEMTLYPTYCRKVEKPEYDSQQNNIDSALPDNTADVFTVPYYETDIRGCVVLPPLQNTRTRLVLAAARRIAGVSGSQASPDVANFEFEETNDIKTYSRNSSVSSQNHSVDNLFADLQSIQNAQSDENTENELNTESIPSQSIPPRPNSKTQPAEILDARMRPFFCRPIIARSIDLEVFSESGESMVFKSVTETESTGRFNTRIKTPFLPSFAIINAGLNHGEIEIEYVSPTGVSVISDIDDTIKISGVAGGKRELLRNVFVKDYKAIEVQGIGDCYKALERNCAAFHYVSNSPWQFYPTVSEFLKITNLPKGSIHMKTYPNLANGIFEPAAERKKKNLHHIFRDFPRRKFLLFGDSGEGDLEAYMDVATTFPSQVAAIMIRDVTLPGDELSTNRVRQSEDGNQLSREEVEFFERNHIPTPEEIDRYENPKQESLFRSIFRSSKPENKCRRSGPTPPALPPRPQNTKASNNTDFSKSVPELSVLTSSQSTQILASAASVPATLQSTQVSQTNNSFENTESNAPPPLPPKILHTENPDTSPYIFKSPDVASKPVTQENKNSTTDSPLNNTAVGYINNSTNDNSTVMSQDPPACSDQKNLTSLEDIPPPLPKRPVKNVIVDSKAQETVGLVSDKSVSSLPYYSSSTDTSARSIDQPTPSSSASLPNLEAISKAKSNYPSSSNQTYASSSRASPGSLFQDDVSAVFDSRVETWIDRVHTARLNLPSHVVLTIWKVGSDIEKKAVEVLKKEVSKIKT